MEKLICRPREPCKKLITHYLFEGLFHTVLILLTITVLNEGNKYYMHSEKKRKEKTILCV